MNSALLPVVSALHPIPQLLPLWSVLLSPTCMERTADDPFFSVLWRFFLSVSFISSFLKFKENPVPLAFPQAFCSLIPNHFCNFYPLSPCQFLLFEWNLKLDTLGIGGFSWGDCFLVFYMYMFHMVA